MTLGRLLHGAACSGAPEQHYLMLVTALSSAGFTDGGCVLAQIDSNDPALDIIFVRVPFSSAERFSLAVLFSDSSLCPLRFLCHVVACTCFRACSEHDPLV